MTSAIVSVIGFFIACFTYLATRSHRRHRLAPLYWRPVIAFGAS